MRKVKLPSGDYQVDDQLNDFVVIEKPSSNVAFFASDILRGRLYVQFKNGSGYMYTEMDENIISFAHNCDSIGKFVSSQVVKKFPSEKLDHSLIMPAIDESEEPTEDQKKNSFYAFDKEPEF